MRGGLLTLYIILGKLSNRPSSTKHISAIFKAIDLILVSLESPKKFAMLYFIQKFPDL